VIKRLGLLIFLFFWLGLIARSQDDNLTFKNITVADGLSESIVLDITQDSLGFMWFATPEALNRFDGSDFKIFPKSFDHQRNQNLFKNGKMQVFGNDLWLVTKGGKLEVFHLETETFSLLQYFGKRGIPIPAVRNILVEDEEKIWIGTENDGLYLVDGNFEIQEHYKKDTNQMNKLVSNKINQIFKDSDGSIWILTDKGVNKIEGKIILTFLEGIHCNIVIEDPTSRILVGTQKNGVFIEIKYLKKFIPFSGMARGIDFPPDLSVFSLHFDLQLRLWIGTYGDGLYILNNTKYQVSHYLPKRNSTNTIANVDILSIFSDENQGIWLGTGGGGISFFDEKTTSFRVLLDAGLQEDVPIEQITSITTGNDSTIWYGTSGSGLVKYQPYTKEAIAFSLKNLVPSHDISNQIRALSTDASGDIWIASEENGIFILDGKNNELKNWFMGPDSVPSELPDYFINCFLMENDSVMWAGSANGLLLINKEYGIVKKFAYSSPDEIRSLVRINETMLAVGFNTAGLATFDLITEEFTPIAVDFIKDNLDQIEINCLYYINDWLWAGTTGKGLMLTNLKSGKTKIFSKSDGLPSDLIYGILPEDSRKIWLSSSRGLFRLIYRKEDGDLYINEVNLYNQKNGFLDNEFKVGAFHRDVNGNLFFGGIRGINFFKPEQLPENDAFVKVVITEVVIDNLSVKSEKSVSYLKDLQLSHHQNSIEFNYTALNVMSQEDLNYSYKLVGYDEDWIDAGMRKYAAYTNLEPGEYEFKVRLTNNTLNEATVATLSISIATPYWQTYWFRLLILSLIIGILYMIYKFRVIHLLELQKVKFNISADLHDDIGARLTTIQLLSAISKPKFGTDSDVKSLLFNIDKEINASSEALDEIVWNIRMNDESLNEVTSNIRRYVSELSENGGLEYVVDTEQDFGSATMSMQKRREIFLICKELMNNILKHAKADRIEIHIGKNKGMYYINVKDNGNGFDPKVETKRNGIMNIKKRVKKWNGDISLQSRLGEGSTIEVWIPFDKKWTFGNIFKKVFNPN
jgi:ligand-binding sensor domain-containing protein/two-component sensor histidine kinase